MNKIVCPNGHNYDTDVFAECPFCGNPGMQILSVDPEAAGMKTEILSGDACETTSNLQEASGVEKTLIDPDAFGESSEKKGGSDRTRIKVLSVLVAFLLVSVMVLLIVYLRKLAEPENDLRNTESGLTEAVSTESKRETESTEKPVTLTGLEVTLEKEKNSGIRQIYILGNNESIELRETCKLLVGLTPEPKDALIRPDMVSWNVEQGKESYLAITQSEDAWEMEVRKTDKNSRDASGNVTVNVAATVNSSDGESVSLTFSVIIRPKGWTKEGQNWYYINGNDSRLTGLRTLDNKRFYFDENGVLQDGFQEIEGQSFYFDLNDGMKTGWVDYSGEDGVHPQGKYYFHEDGTMAADSTEIIEGKTRIFDKDGLLKEE